MKAAISLLAKARDNGGGLELHDVFGPAAETLATAEQVLRAVQDHLALQWCLQHPPLLEVKHNGEMMPPSWFLLTPAGEAYATLQGTPAELTSNSPLDI